MKVSSNLQSNLAALRARRNKAKQRRSSILDTIVEISRTRAAAAPGSAGISDMSRFQPAVARSLSAGGGKHSMNDGHGHTSSAQVKGLNRDFNTALQRLIRDSGGKIKVGSGYRSIAQQAVLYDRYKRGVKGQAPAAKPGSSNHNFGLAADLVYQGGMHGPTGKWARANARKYGLVFPMSYEPWHIEPINARAKRGK